MSGADLTFSTDGLFTRFYPETAAGEVAWAQLPDAGVIYTMRRQSTVQQLRAAGYVVRAAKPVPKFDEDAMLAALGVAA